MALEKKPSVMDKMNLIPITQAAKRYFCSVRHLERLGKRGVIDVFHPAKERVVDTISADIWFMSTKEGPRKDSEGNIIRRGRGRIR